MKVQHFAEVDDVVSVFMTGAADGDAVTPAQRPERLGQFVLIRNLSAFDKNGDHAGSRQGECGFHFDSDVIARIFDSPATARIGASRPFLPDEDQYDRTVAQAVLDVGREIDAGWDGVNVTKDGAFSEARRQRIVDAIHHLLAVGAAVAHEDGILGQRLCHAFSIPSLGREGEAEDLSALRSRPRLSNEIEPVL